MKLHALPVLVTFGALLTERCHRADESTLPSMTTEEALQIVKAALTAHDEGLGMCPVPHFNRDTRTPRFQSADTEKLTYLDNKGGGGCTNDCPDPDHQFTLPYTKIKRVFISRTQPTAACRYGNGIEVIQVIGWHEWRNFVMASVRTEDLPKVLGAFRQLNPKIAIKNSILTEIPMKQVIAAALLTLICLNESSALAADNPGNPDSYVLPQAAGMPIEQLARVVAVMGSKNTDTVFVALFDASRKEIRKRKFPVVSVSGKLLTLTPGKYFFSVQCGRLDARYLPMSMLLEAGHTYSVRCEPVPWSMPVLKFEDQTHLEWDAHVTAPAPAPAPAPAG